MIQKLLGKNKINAEEEQRLRKEKTAQQWMPVEDITDKVVYLKNKMLVAAVRVGPINIHLLSEREQKAKIQMLYEVLNGLEYAYQPFSAARPVDLNGYIARQEQLKQVETDYIRRKLYTGSIQAAAYKATSGEALERYFYVVIPERAEGHAEDIVIQKATDLAGALTDIGLVSHVCSDQELREMNFIFTHPAQASVEQMPTGNLELPVFYQGGKD